MALKVDFKDDILNENVNSRRKYNLIYNSDGTVSLQDATAYTQEGDLFGGGEINTTNKAVNDLGTSINSLTTDALLNSTLVETFGTQTAVNIYFKLSGVATQKEKFVAHIVINSNTQTMIGYAIGTLATSTTLAAATVINVGSRAIGVSYASAGDGVYRIKITNITNWGLGMVTLSPNFAITKWEMATS